METGTLEGKKPTKTECIEGFEFLYWKAIQNNETRLAFEIWQKIVHLPGDIADKPRKAKILCTHEGKCPHKMTEMLIELETLEISRQRVI